MNQANDVEHTWILTDIEGQEWDLEDPNFDMDQLRKAGLMPEDYSLCGTCGFDHEYDRPGTWKEIYDSHMKEENEFRRYVRSHARRNAH